MKCKYADFQFLLINMVIIIGSPKPVIVSRASETHCGPAKIYFGWPDWPTREKVKHDPWIPVSIPGLSSLGPVGGGFVCVLWRMSC